MKASSWNWGAGTAAGVVALGVVALGLCELVPSADGARCGRSGSCGAPRHGEPGAGAPVVSDRPRLLVFSSTSCPACALMAPVVADVERSCGTKDVVHVGVDDDPGEALVATYHVAFLPSFVSVDAEGREVSRLTGLQSERRLEQAIEEIGGVRCATVATPADTKAM